MRVLIASSLYPTPAAPKVIGGAELFARQFAEQLVAEGDEVEVVRAAETQGQVREACNGVEVHSAPVRNIHPPYPQSTNPVVRGLWHAVDDWPAAANLVSDRIRSFQPEIIHTHTLSGLTTGIWQAARTHGLPIVHTLHDYYLTCPRCSRFADGATCATTCTTCQLFTVNRRRATRDVAAVVGVSQRILDIHVDLGLFHGASIRRVIRHASSVHLGEKARQPGEKPVVFGFIGRLTVEKGIEHLVRAMDAFGPRQARLLIAGPADYADRQRLRALAPKADIDFLGFVPPEDFYGLVDVVVIPSIWEEPGPIVLIEAWAACRPVLGTPFGGMPELIKEGVNGWIAQPKSTAFVERMKAIVEDPTLIESMTAHLRAGSGRRTMADVAGAYRDIYEQVASSDQRASAHAS